MAVSVEPADIESVWRPLTAAEDAIIPGLSDHAWIRIKAGVPGIEDNLAASSVSEATLKSVMVSMILRVLKNPDSARQISKSADDWSKSLTLDEVISSGELYLSEAERLLLLPPTETPNYGMYVVPLGG